MSGRRWKILLLFFVSVTSLSFPEDDCPSLLNTPDEMKKFGKQRRQAILGWDKLITWTLSPKNKPCVLKEPLEEKVFSVSEQALFSFDQNYGYFSIYHPIVGVVTNSVRDIKTTNCLIDVIEEDIENVFQKRFSTEEVLAKVVAYRPLEKGMQVSGPNGGVYVVDTVINLWRGMPAFGLIPKEGTSAPPILLFRGTDLNLTSEKGWASVLCDLDTSGPGHETFLRARGEIHQWLVKVKQSHSPSRLIGFSLGGVFVFYTMIYESELVNLEIPSIAFNPPGVSQDLYNAWEGIKVKPPYYTFVNQGDFVSQIGLLLGNTWEISLPKPMCVIAAHVTLISAQPKYEMRAVDLSKENASRKK